MFTLLPIFLLSQTMTAVQKDLDAMYAKWDKAIIAHDKKTMESILAPNFSAKVKGFPKPMTKQQFMDGITGGWKSPASQKEQSFTTKINKVTQNKTLFMANINESIVFKMNDGKTKKQDFKSLDTWQRVGKTWQIVATESIE